MKGAMPRDPAAAAEAAQTNEAAAIASRYAARDAVADAQRYSLFDAAALQAHQERQRAMLALWRRHGWNDLAGRDIVEVGCGSGGNLLDLVRLGAQPERLIGIDLLPERLAAARARLPQALRLVCTDASRLALPAASQHAVLAFTVFSSVLDDAVRAALATALWRWLRPGGGVLLYDFAIDNPANAAVRALTHRQVVALFPQAQARRLPVTLAPPLARTVAKVSPRLIGLANTLLPLLRTHRLWWLRKTE